MRGHPPHSAGPDSPGHRSQASPIPSASVSACVGLGADGQLSTASSTPSRSASRFGVNARFMIASPVAPRYPPIRMSTAPETLTDEVRDWYSGPPGLQESSSHATLVSAPHPPW